MPQMYLGGQKWTLTLLMIFILVETSLNLVAISKEASRVLVPGMRYSERYENQAYVL